MSPLTQGRGLKLDRGQRLGKTITVAPHTGAWIETQLGNLLLQRRNSRPSHRGVD